MGRYYPDCSGEAEVVERHPPVGYAREVMKHDGFIPKVIGGVGIVRVFEEPKQGVLVGYGLKVFVGKEGDKGFGLKEVMSGRTHRVVVSPRNVRNLGGYLFGNASDCDVNPVLEVSDLLDAGVRPSGYVGHERRAVGKQRR